MATKKELKEELKDLGFELEGKPTKADYEDAIVEALAEVDDVIEKDVINVGDEVLDPVGECHVLLRDDKLFAIVDMESTQVALCPDQESADELMYALNA